MVTIHVENDVLIRVLRAYRNLQSDGSTLPVEAQIPPSSPQSGDPSERMPETENFQTFKGLFTLSVNDRVVL